MRLVCGVWHLDGRLAAPDLVSDMARAMVAPGLTPAVRAWREGPLALATVDYSCNAHERQNFTSISEDGVLAADIRLDEPQALAGRLCLGPSDDEALLVAAIRRWGADAPRQLLGDFAFAWWDRHAQTLSCARDAVGIRPLVYLHQPERLFAFASLPRAIHGAGLVERRLDETALAARVLFAFRADDTLCTDVRRLPAAHLLEVSRRGLSVRRYWQLERATAGSNRLEPEEAAREMTRLFDAAVRCRLPVEGPVATHLSGGLDSSAIAIHAARRLQPEGRDLLAYSFLSSPADRIPTDDERPQVDLVLAQESCIHWTPLYSPPLAQWLGAGMDVDRLVSIDPRDPENAACADAAARGAWVMLSGWGGDEGPTFNGRGTLAEGLLRGRWGYIAAETAALRRTRGWSPVYVCRAELLSYFVPRSMRILQRRLRGRPASFLEQVRRLVTPAVDVAFDSIDPEDLGRAPDGRENQWRLLSSAHLAERTENWATIGARHGMSFAFPMLDRRLLEFALSLPSSLFLRGGHKRRVFRDAMEGVLPEGVRWAAQKTVPMADRMAAIADDRRAIARYLDGVSAHPRARAFFSLDDLRAVVSALPAPDGVRAGSADFVSLNVVMVLLPAVAYVEQHY